MTDAYILFALSTVVTILSAIFWKWNSSISKSNDRAVTKIDELTVEVQDFKSEIYQNYQSKTEAHRDTERIISMLQDIKGDVGKLSDKLDSKADK